MQTVKRSGANEITARILRQKFGPRIQGANRQFIMLVFPRGVRQITVRFTVIGFELECLDQLAFCFSILQLM